MKGLIINCTYTYCLKVLGIKGLKSTAGRWLGAAQSIFHSLYLAHSFKKVAHPWFSPYCCCVKSTAASRDRKVGGDTDIKLLKYIVTGTKLPVQVRQKWL